MTVRINFVQHWKKVAKPTTFDCNLIWRIYSNGETNSIYTQRKFSSPGKANTNTYCMVFKVNKNNLNSSQIIKKGGCWDLISIYFSQAALSPPFFPSLLKFISDTAET